VPGPKGETGEPGAKGEPLFSIYSPEVLASQEEYVLALRTRSKLDRGAMARDGEALVASARRKLELLDVPESHIQNLARTGEPSRTITLYSPASGVLTKKDVVPGMRVNAGDMPFEIIDLSRVWVLADAYESDLAQVKVGMNATLTLKAFPERAFQGHVTFIDPLLDPQTRTAKVRIEFPNEGGELRPEMFGEVVLQGVGHEGLRIPADAVIHPAPRRVRQNRGSSAARSRQCQTHNRGISVLEGDAWSRANSSSTPSRGCVRRSRRCRIKTPQTLTGHGW
jgi:Cu(I)/Ag(I) efflux system membrane fusion protein